MANISNIYSDIDFTFLKKPAVGDVSLSYDTQAVIRSVRNLLLTRRFERPFNPKLGSSLDDLLFENINPLLASAIKDEIQTTIENYEPRALLKDVTVTAKPDNNAYDVSITFYIENATLPTTVTLLLERNR